MISPFYILLSLLHRPASRAVIDIFIHEGLPRLLELYDELLLRSRDEREDDLLLILTMFALYEFDDGVERLMAAIRDDLFSEGRSWEEVFKTCGENAAVGIRLCNSLSDALPRGRLSVRLLELANSLCARRLLAEHPFDNEHGRLLLAGLLRAGEDGWSDALHAAGALMYLDPDSREDLIGLALDHEAREIAMDGARAAASTGSAAALQTLARFCLDRLCSREACQYLEEFGRPDLIPEKARDPGFRAECDLCLRLAYPTQFGIEPHEIELFDTRELFWPPTKDRRRLWLFKYTYQVEDGDPIVGVGLSGSKNVALDSVSPEMSPEEIYAHHCYWEFDEGPWLPGDRREVAGREMLQQHNPGF